MEEAVENGCGEGLVPSEHLGPVADGLVRCDADGAALVPVTDQTEEQVGVFAGERLEADLVDDEQSAVHVLPALEVCRRGACVLAQGVEEFLDAEVGRGETTFHCRDAEGDGEVRLADARWSEQQQRLAVADPLTGRQHLDARAFDRWLEGEVEGRQRRSQRQARELEAGADAALLATVALDAEQAAQEVRRVEVVLHCVAQDR